MDPIPGTEGYATSLASFVAAAESVDFHALHRPILHLLPAPPARVLDLGAGTGRDAAALAAMGHDLVAVEPSPALLDAARTLHASPAIRWVADSLPSLATLSAGATFDFTLCHAVWQHLNDGERTLALGRVAGLLEPGGIFALALRHGPPGVGTRTFGASVDATVGRAAAFGLDEVLRLENRPSLLAGKGDVTWSRLAFRKRG